MTTWHLIQRKNLKPPSELKDKLAAHLAWLQKLHAAGTVLFSGPTKDGAYGLFVVRAESSQAAADVARQDPMTAAGLCSFEVLEWRVDQALGVGAFTPEQIAALNG